MWVEIKVEDVRNGCICGYECRGLMASRVGKGKWEPVILVSFSLLLCWRKIPFSLSAVHYDYCLLYFNNQLALDNESPARIPPF